MNRKNEEKWGQISDVDRKGDRGQTFKIRLLFSPLETQSPSLVGFLHPTFPLGGKWGSLFLYFSIAALDQILFQPHEFLSEPILLPLSNLFGKDAVGDRHVPTYQNT
jgi:hypothetical protein